MHSEKRGQLFGFIIALTIIISGAILIAIGKSAVGLSLIITDAVTLVGMFFYVDVRKRQELANKALDEDDDERDEAVTTSRPNRPTT